MTKEALFALMKGTVIVSCQATPGEPLYDRERSVMPLMARAAKLAGAKMIRTSSVRDIIEIKEETGLPVLVAEDPLTCVVRGCGIALEKIDEFETVFSYE